MNGKRKEKQSRNGKERGAISVFIIIVLVPCIALACIFGDVSRVQMSKMQAISSGDLAMYSLLAHFDKDLKEYYGLVASVQNIDEFYEKTATYFTGMMSARGVSGEGSELFLDYLYKLKNDPKNISDFLQVEFVKPATVKELENSSLGDNAALLEDAIVEFMKYRGPYELVKNLIDRLRSNQVIDDVEGAKKDEPIVEARQDYAEAEGDMLKAFFYSYVAQKKYVERRKQTNPPAPSYQLYQDTAKDLQLISEDLLKVTELITKNYVGTDGIRLVEFPLYDRDYIDHHYIVSNITQVKVDELLKDIDTKVAQVEEIGQRILNGCSSLSGLKPEKLDSDTNYPAYCMVVQNNVSNSDLRTLSNDADFLIKRRAILKASLNYVPPAQPPASQGNGGTSSDFSDGKNSTAAPQPQNDPLPSNWKELLTGAIEQIDTCMDTYFLKDTQGQPERISSPYLQMVHRYQLVAKDRDTVNYVKYRRYTFQSAYVNNTVTIGEFQELIRSKYDEIVPVMKEQLETLRTIIYGQHFSYNKKRYKAPSLDSLKKKIRDFSNERNNWGNAIAQSGSTSDYAQSEQREYDGATSSHDTKSDKNALVSKRIAELGEEAVDELRTRLENLIHDIEDWQKGIKNFTYGGTQILETSGRKELISLGKKVIPNSITLSLKECEEKSKTYYDQLMNKNPLYKAPDQVKGPKGNNPDLDQDMPALYELGKNQFDQQIEKIEDKVQDSQKKNKEYQKEADKQTESAKGVEEKYLVGKGGDLTEGHGGKTVNAFSGIWGLVDVIKKILEGNGDELRDPLYVVEYAMDMFSYSSFHNEGQHRLAREKGKDYTKDKLQDGKYPEVGESWFQEEKTEVYENQSLTNVPINSDHNQMCLGEIEYILYGDKKLDKNLKTAYLNLFAIREGLNLVSGFQNFYSGSNETANVIAATAASIMAATCGVVPEAVTKCVLIGVLATLESANDLARLKAGVPVVIYKKKDTDWCVAISRDDDDNSSFPMGQDKIDKKGIYYSDYMYFFLLMGASHTETYTAMLLRMGDLIQANLRKVDGKDSFALNKSRMFFRLEGELKVKPLFLDLPIVTNYTQVDTSSLKNTAGWCSYSLSLIRGYS